jgi:DNA-binding response OmpR family regulator
MPKVLIIEDRRENIVFIANNILRPMGYDIITARDGELGLQKALEERPDLIITDLKLPRMNGLTVLERLRDKKVQIPTIVMTFHGTEETAVRALRLGARDYLIKPFTFDEMQDALKRALAAQPGSPAQVTELEAKIKKLEATITELQKTITQRDLQIDMLQKQSANSADKMDMAVLAQRAAAWEEYYAKLNERLAQTTDLLQQEENRAAVLESTLDHHKTHMQKYEQTARQLAIQLRNLSEGMRLMAQSASQELERLTTVSADGQPEPPAGTGPGQGPRR